MSPVVVNRRAPARLVADGIRRWIWRTCFETGLHRLGCFFLDASDHIGRERLIGLEPYEAANLRAIELLAARLGAAEGVALDIGANIGNHSCALLPWFKRVVSVEPGRVASLVLEANLLASGHRNWSVSRCALGAKSGQGFLRRAAADNLGSSTLSACEPGAEPVAIQTGDELILQHGLQDSKVALLKLDVEGAELEALQGLAQTLSRDGPLVCVEALDAGRWRQIDDFLRSRGYVHFMALRATGAGWARLLRGESQQLAPLPPAFPPGGFDMVFCLTGAHAAQLRAAAQAGRP